MGPPASSGQLAPGPPAARRVPQRTCWCRRENSSRQASAPREPSTIIVDSGATRRSACSASSAARLPTMGSPGGVHDPPRPVILIHLGGNSSCSQHQRRPRVHQAQCELAPHSLVGSPTGSGQALGRPVEADDDGWLHDDCLRLTKSQNDGVGAALPHCCRPLCHGPGRGGRQQDIEGLSSGLGKGIRVHGRQPCGRTTAARYLTCWWVYSVRRRSGRPGVRRRTPHRRHSCTTVR